MIVLSEASPQLPDSASLRDIERATDAARIAGCRVYHIPQDLPEGVSADDALWHIPRQEAQTPGLWIGYIPLPEHYEVIYQAALSRNILLVNSPEQYRRAEEFDRFYPFIADITAKSSCVTALDECLAAAETIGYPVFLKGTIQSLKAEGVGACVAYNSEELQAIARKIFISHRRSLGKIIVRECLRLRHSRIGPGDFPLGREYRVFVHQGTVAGMGYYWEGDDDLAALSPEESHEVIHLALEAARRLQVPYLAVDVGQLENGHWLVIEVGDGQFSGLSQTPIHQLWSRLAQADSLV